MSNECCDAHKIGWPAAFFLSVVIVSMSSCTAAGYFAESEATNYYDMRIAQIQARCNLGLSEKAD